MPFILIVIGFLLLISGVKNKAKDLFLEIKTDSKEFIPYVAVIVPVAILGYFKPLKTVSNYFLFLVVVTLFLASGKSFFLNLKNGVTK